MNSSSDCMLTAVLWTNKIKFWMPKGVLREGGGRKSFNELPNSKNTFQLLTLRLCTKCTRFWTNKNKFWMPKVVLEGGGHDKFKDFPELF